jgi:outer membrane protein assembly factor BamE
LNKIILLIAFSILISGQTTGCSRRADGSVKIPLVYRVDIQQGNVIEQSMIDKLEPGMTRAKVKFIMGTPLLVDPFHSNRWEYIYSIEPGSGVRAQRHVTLFFNGDKLTHIEGNVTPANRYYTDEEIDETSNVLITGQRKKKGFFGRWFGTKDEIKKADQTRDEENQKVIDALSEDVSRQADESALPLPERDSEQVERDFEVLDQTGEQF